MTKKKFKIDGSGSSKPKVILFIEELFDLLLYKSSIKTIVEKKNFQKTEFIV